MALEMRLEQKQTQRLILSPQMQQAIHLLQLPLMELKTLVEAEMVQNPVLDEEMSKDSEDTAPETSESSSEEASNKELDDNWKDSIEEDVYQPPHRSSKDASELHDFLETLITKDVSLKEHLDAQLCMLDLNPEQMRIGAYIIGNLNHDGYLDQSVDEMAGVLKVMPIDIEMVLTQIQLLDPVGIAARNLQECLLVQLISMGKQSHLAYRILTKHIDLLERKRFLDIAKSCHVSVQEVQKAVGFIATLEPKPGRRFSTSTPHYIVPDVIIQKIEDEYVIITNDLDLPRLRVNSFYRQMMKDRNRDKETRNYVKEKVQSALWLIKSIQQRQKTIYRITDEIIKAQPNFLEHGISHLKPLTLKSIAEKLELNLSTVSRAVMNKYVQTPLGVFEIRKLFSTPLTRDEGTLTSAVHVQQLISDIIQKEDPKKPISDQAIAKTLKKGGITIARRTVAKYREEKLKIPPSHMRRAY